MKLRLVLAVAVVITVIRGPRSLNPKPQTLNPKPKTLNPKPQTLNPKPQTPNPKRAYILAKICPSGSYGG